MPKGGKADEPLKDSMHALMRLFLCSPDEEEANEGGVSMMTPAARPGDGCNEIHWTVIIKEVSPPRVGRPTPAGLRRESSTGVNPLTFRVRL